MSLCRSGRGISSSQGLSIEIRSVFEARRRALGAEGEEDLDGGEAKTKKICGGARRCGNDFFFNRSHRLNFARRSLVHMNRALYM